MFSGEEVGEEDGAAYGSEDGFGAGEASGAEAGGALAVEEGHVGYGDVAERIDDGVAAAACFSGDSEEFEDYGGEEGVGGSYGEEVEG